ncbi:hypothetical protein KIN20_034455 [Parelaphostrongylus tenuis]|uniref:Uncharacterized protein n=1 Tax=Parelaphostrongylus tenuis TaxID=148309 RepID=A0AAD5WJ76_PARTN|nr:hypothetical protein KIN20_034455 [Parelaphostrongylus tenuis]
MAPTLLDTTTHYVLVEIDIHYLQLQSLSTTLDKAFQLSFLEPGMRVRIQPLRGRPHSVFFKSCSMKLIETSDSGIPELDTDPDNYQNTDDYSRRYAKWIIGLDWIAYIDM